AIASYYSIMRLALHHFSSTSPDHNIMRNGISDDEIKLIIKSVIVAPTGKQSRRLSPFLSSKTNHHRR
ncbi:hypothetical protein, partial [Psychromonas hadalis]|uniref:hypothetical protein n=1 Tax=Psychromonas hadalis TaxID=211669 RepID=UPI001B7FD70D